MWAQLITTRLKPGKEGELQRLVEQLRATEQPGRAGALDGDAGPERPEPGLHVGRLRERGEGPRRENDPRREERAADARATMAEIFDGAPEFVDLTVVDEMSP